MPTAKKAKKQTAITSGEANKPPRSSLMRHYTTYMPKRRSHRMLIWMIVGVVFAIISVQLLYPPDRGLPLASVPGRSLALATHEVMAKAITDQFDTSKVKLTLGTEKSAEYFLKITGAEPNTEEMITSLSNYPLWQRFIPGSILWQSARLNEIDVYYSAAIYKQFVDTRARDF